MKKQRIYFIFLFFVCVLMPSVAMADFDINLSEPDSHLTIVPGRNKTFTVEVQEDGRPVSGQTVTFSVTPNGEFEPDEFASVSPTSATTDSNGQAQTTLSLTGDTSAYQYVVWAKLDNGQSDANSVPVGVVSDGAELSLAINNLRTYHPGESAGFTFYLFKVEDGTGVSGKTVTFSVSPDDGTASVSPTSATTNSNGNARTTLVLGSNASGKYRVTATLDDGTSKSNGIPSVYNPTPLDFFLSMSIPRGAIPLSPGESRTFTAIAEKDGNYVSGKTVTFSVSPDDGTVSLSTTSATTDSNGEASTTLTTGSGSSGSYTVTARGTSSGGRRPSISGTVTVDASLPPVEVSPPEVIVISRSTSESKQNNPPSTSESKQNNPPVFSDGTSTTRSVAENTASGTDIGSPVTATDVDGNTLTYSLSGTDAASFSIDSSTGQLRTAAALDYETKKVYNLTITATDASGAKTNIDVTINVTDVNETVTPPPVQQPQPNPQPQQSQPDPQVESQPEPQDQQSQPDPQVESQPEPQAQQSQPDPQVESQPEPQAQQPQPDPQVESQPEPQAQQPQPDPQPQPQFKPQESFGRIVCSEIMLSQMNKDFQRDDLPQWIELYNTTNQDIDIKGWKIVGRYLDDSNTMNILESQVISKSLTIKGKETFLIVSYATPNSRDRISTGLADKADALGSNSKNFWNYEGFVLELQDAEGNPVDRIGNLNDQNEIAWEIPSIVRDGRVSLIRRLKSIRSQEYNFTFGIKKFGWLPANENERLAKGRSQSYYGRYTDIGSPGYRTEDGEILPVTLSSFNPRVNQDDSVVISWITESEVDNAGFYVLRSNSKRGPFVRVNPKLIQGAGTTGERNAYTWIDTSAKPNIEYYYQIEDVSFAGIKQTLATQRLKGIHTAKNRALTNWGIIKQGSNK